MIGSEGVHVHQVAYSLYHISNISIIEKTYRGDIRRANFPVKFNLIHCRAHLDMFTRTVRLKIYVQSTATMSRYEVRLGV